MCAVRTQPYAHRPSYTSSAAVLQLDCFIRRRMDGITANDNRLPQTVAWRTAGALFGVAVAGCTALAVALVGL